MKPKTLYQYNTHHQLEKHKVASGCNPQKICDWPGPRYRCRTEKHDFYGWSKLKDARSEEISLACDAIHKLKLHLESLIKKRTIGRE